jgi:hypothetical protein
MSRQARAVKLSQRLNTRLRAVAAAVSSGIVTSGLVMHLDAGNAASYPGSGTAWTDLTVNGNNGTLTNGPTYSAADGGQIVFDGVNDYIIGTNNASVQITEGTIACWVRCQTEPNYVGLISKNRAWSLVANNDVLGCYDWGNAAFRSTGINIADNSWRYIALTFTNTVGTPSNNAIIYVNGAAVLTTTTKHVNQATEFGLAVAEASSGENLRGGIAIGHIYNRVLSAAEIQQNFDANKARFGL